MTILNDKQIADRARDHGMIAPFTESLVRVCDGRPIISYGLSGHGYDLRLSPKEFRRLVPSKCVNPKRQDSAAMTEIVRLQHDDDGSFFTMPPHSYALGVALEYLRIPPDVMVQCVGKSTYARAGIVANITPAEAGWCGHLTLEFANNSPSPVRIYANEGVVQLLFYQGETAGTCYESRAGKYQDQPEQVIMGRV